MGVRADWQLNWDLDKSEVQLGLELELLYFFFLLNRCMYVCIYVFIYGSGGEILTV